MDKVYVGKIVSTHGIKGEIKILTQFNFKDKVFKVGNSLIIDDKEYVKQLKGYKKYIEGITDKKINTYLYSVIDRDLKEVK